MFFRPPSVSNLPTNSAKPHRIWVRKKETSRRAPQRTQSSTSSLFLFFSFKIWNRHPRIRNTRHDPARVVIGRHGKNVYCMLRPGDLLMMKCLYVSRSLEASLLTFHKLSSLPITFSLSPSPVQNKSHYNSLVHLERRLVTERMTRKNPNGLDQSFTRISDCCGHFPKHPIKIQGPTLSSTHLLSHNVKNEPSDLPRVTQSSPVNLVCLVYLGFQLSCHLRFLSCKRANGVGCSILVGLGMSGWRAFLDHCGAGNGVQVHLLVFLHGLDTLSSNVKH